MPVDIPEIIMRLLTSARMVTNEYADEVNKITRDMLATLLAMYGISPKRFPKPPIIARDEHYTQLGVTDFCVGIEKINFEFLDFAFARSPIPIIAMGTGFTRPPLQFIGMNTGFTRPPLQFIAQGWIYRQNQLFIAQSFVYRQNQLFVAQMNGVIQIA